MVPMTTEDCTHLRGPLQVLPTHNVQPAKEIMCLVLLELGLRGSEIRTWLVHSFHLRMCVRHK